MVAVVDHNSVYGHSETKCPFPFSILPAVTESQPHRDPLDMMDEIDKEIDGIALEDDDSLVSLYSNLKHLQCRRERPKMSE